MRREAPYLLALFLAATAIAAPLAGQATWTVERAPLLDVPGLGANGKVTFGYAAGAMRLADGSLLIADRTENAIRLVDAKGALVRTIGRAGDGPGEFRSIISAGGCGTDSMLVWDLRSGRGSLVGAGGGVRQFTLAAADTAQPPFRFSCAGTRTIAYVSMPRPARGAAANKDPNVMAVTAALYRITADGGIQQRFGDIAAGEMLMLTSPSGGRGSAPRPLGRAAAMAVVGNSVVIGAPDSAVATIISSDGKRRDIRLPIAPRAPTRAEYEAAVAATASLIPGPIRTQLADQLGAYPMPDRIPAIAALFADSDGLLWVQSSPAGAKVIDLLVARLDGSVVARVQIPAALTVFEVGRDYILGSYTDTEEETHVAVYRLRRTPLARNP
jgi:hypothetical protein